MDDEHDFRKSNIAAVGTVAADEGEEGEKEGEEEGGGREEWGGGAEGVNSSAYLTFVFGTFFFSQCSAL